MEAESNLSVGDNVKVIVDNPKYGWGNVTKDSIGVITCTGKIVEVNFPEQPTARFLETELKSTEDIFDKIERLMRDKEYYSDLD